MPKRKNEKILRALRPSAKRSEAKALGLARYFTGVPCRRGHIAERATVNGTCHECMRQDHLGEKGKRWRRTTYINHQETRRAERRIKGRQQALAAHPERVSRIRTSREAKKIAKEQGKSTFVTGVPCKHGHRSPRFTSNGNCVACAAAWQSANSAIANKNRRDWVINNPEKARLSSRLGAHRRRAIIRASNGDVTAEDVQSIMKAQKHKCPESGRSIKRRYHIDHVKPLSKGGVHNRSNVQLLCPPCNQRKSSRDPIQWARLQGRLL